MDKKNNIDLKRRDFLKITGAGAVAATAAMYGCGQMSTADKNTSASGEMTYRVNPHTGDKVSLLGYGCMRLPLRTNSAGEEEIERAAPKITESAAALMEELFAMKRGMAFKEKTELREEVVTEEEIPSTDIAILETVETEAVAVSEVAEPVLVADSVARQFADGETTIKMVYIDHEEETLGGVLDRYEATLDDVWNLDELAGGVTVGDCVMLRYEKAD